MALSATMTLSLSSVQLNQPTLATLTISNSGGSNVNLLSCQPTVVQTGNSMASDKTPFAAGNVLDGNALSPVVPAGGNLIVTFPFIFFEPSVSTYSCSANLSTSDGSYFSPTPVTCTATQLQFNDAAPGFPTNP